MFKSFCMTREVDSLTQSVRVSFDELVKSHALFQQVVGWFTKMLQQAQDAGFRSAAQVISTVLRDPKLSSKERRILVDVLYDLLRKLRRLKALCGTKKPSPTQYSVAWLSDKALEFGIDDRLVWGKIRAMAEAVGLSIDEIAENAMELEKAYVLGEIDVNRLSDAESYPTWQVDLLLKEHGVERTLEILRGQNRRAPLSIRVNTLRTDVHALADQLLAEGICSVPMKYSTRGLILKTRTNAYGLRAFQEGLFELQDEGSQLIAELVAPPPASTVIDACAGAGGKTLALGALLGNQGRLLALDIDERKLVELRKRARRAGLSNVQALSMSNSHTGSLRAFAKRVLCDVPCSGLGVLRRNPEARWAIQRNDIDELCRKQLSILVRASEWVSEGGRLIYSTCTLMERENQEVIRSFLQQHPSFVLMPVKEIWGTAKASLLGDGTFFQTYPTEEDGPDGFFAAVLRKVVRSGE